MVLDDMKGGKSTLLVTLVGDLFEEGIRWGALLHIGLNMAFGAQGLFVLLSCPM